MLNTISKKTRKKTRKKTCNNRPSTPTKKYKCGYPETVKVKENPNYLLLNELQDYQEQNTLIKDFLNLSTTQPGDFVNYSGPNQLDTWGAIVQIDNNGNKCLGHRKNPNDYPSDNETDNESDSYLSDSSYVGKKHKSKK